ncbi:MAG: hypothetical protein WBA28_06900 [Microbacteriaceae bacterium]
MSSDNQLDSRAMIPVTVKHIARISVNSALPQLDRLFDYLIPDSLRDVIGVGSRVKVPFRNSLIEGFVVELAALSDYEGPLVAIEELVSLVPLVKPEMYQFARALADRNVGTVRDVLRLAIPPRQVRVEKAWIAARNQTNSAESSAGDDVKEPISYAQEQSEFFDNTELSAQLEQLLHHRYGTEIDTLLQNPGHRIALGVSTGVSPASSSSLPNWCLDLAAIAISLWIRGESSILVVPDFRDLENLRRALAEYLPEEHIFRLDSAQSNAERYRNYLHCLDGQAKVVLGNRSAIYAPLSSVGAIILWDDSDPLHAEPMAPYPHGRDAALLRQQLSNARLILASHSRSIAAERLVELNWLQEINSKIPTPKIVLPSGQDVEQGARIPSQVMQGLSEGLKHGPVLVQVARPSNSAQSFPEDRLPTASQTAAELGRAFPGVPVLIAEGDKVIEHVDNKPKLIISTRGAEPLAEGGYHAIALLDGMRMMGRESLNVAEDCLRWWSNAAALATAQAPVYVNAVPSEVGQAMASWRQDRYASRELNFRRELRLPPAIRTATLSGHSGPVEATRKKLGAIVSRLDHHFLEPKQESDELRILLKFDYRDGELVAGILREEVIRYAAARGKLKPRLRVRMDEPELNI